MALGIYNKMPIYPIFYILKGDYGLSIQHEVYVFFKLRLLKRWQNYSSAKIHRIATLILGAPSLQSEYNFACQSPGQPLHVVLCVYRLFLDSQLNSQGVTQGPAEAKARSKATEMTIHQNSNTCRDALYRTSKP